MDLALYTHHSPTCGSNNGQYKSPVQKSSTKVQYKAQMPIQAEFVAYAITLSLLALLAAAVLNVDYLIMSQTLSAQEIAAYNVLEFIGLAYDVNDGCIWYSTWID